VLGVVVVSAIAVGTMRTLSRLVLAHAVASSGTPQDPAAPVAIAAPAPPAQLPPPAPVSVAAAVPPADPVPVAAAAPAMEPVPGGPVAAKVDDTLTECQTEIRRERARQALAACEKAANDNPTLAVAQVALAHANLLAGRDRETLRLARRASALDPLCGDAYLFIGSVQQSAGRPADARSAYESYLRTAPHGSHAAEIRAILKTL